MSKVRNASFSLLAVLLLVSGRSWAQSPPDANAAYSKEYQTVYGSAVQAFNKGNPSETIHILDDAEKIQPGLPTTLNLRAAAYVRLKRLDEARQVFESLHKSKPDDPSIIFNMAEVYFLGRNYVDAKKMFQLYLEKKGQSQNALGLYKVFLCDLMTNNTAEIKKTLSNLIPAANNPYYYFAMAADALKRGEGDKGRDYIKSAYDIYSPQLNASFADSLVELGFIRQEEVGSVGVIDSAFLQSLTQPKMKPRKKDDVMEIDASGLDALLPPPEKSQPGK